MFGVLLVAFAFANEELLPPPLDLNADAGLEPAMEPARLVREAFAWSREPSPILDTWERRRRSAGAPGQAQLVGLELPGLDRPRVSPFVLGEGLQTQRLWMLHQRGLAPYDQRGSLDLIGTAFPWISVNY